MRRRNTAFAVGALLVILIGLLSSNPSRAGGELEDPPGDPVGLAPTTSASPSTTEPLSLIHI